MKGLRYRLKSRESLASKISTRVSEILKSESLGGLNREAIEERVVAACNAVAEKLNDVLRFTFALPYASFARILQRLLELLEAEGFKVTDRKNYSTNAVYKVSKKVNCPSLLRCC